MNKHERGISFIVPAYNEEAGIAETLDRLNTVLTASGLPYEIILVNDGSSDKTAERAGACANVTIIYHPANIGYGGAIKTGIMHANFHWIGITDADGTYPVERITDLLAEMEKGFDMAVAKRENINQHDSIAKMFFRRLFKGIINFTVHGDIQDPNSGLRIFKREMALSYFPFLCNTFSFTTSITILAFGEGRFVRYLPVRYEKRTGKGKVRHFRDSLYAMEIIIQGITFYNPIKFFILFSIGIIALVCFPAMVLAVFKMHTLSLYYMIFGSLVSVLVAIGILGDIIRVSGTVRHGIGVPFPQRDLKIAYGRPPAEEGSKNP